MESLKNAVQQKEEMLEASIKIRESYVFQTEILCACMTVGTKDYEFGQTQEITQGVQEKQNYVHEE